MPFQPGDPGGIRRLEPLQLTCLVFVIGDTCSVIGDTSATHFSSLAKTRRHLFRRWQQKFGILFHLIWIHLEKVNLIKNVKFCFTESTAGRKTRWRQPKAAASVFLGGRRPPLSFFGSRICETDPVTLSYRNSF